MSTLDGPGFRFVVFMQGCLQRCIYCHNPDTWDENGGQEWTVNDLFNKILKYKELYAASSGGVTFSGGEPLIQPEFVYQLIELLNNENIHTALDTSGFFKKKDNDIIYKLTDKADLILLDIKSAIPETHKIITGNPIESFLEFIEILNKLKKQIILRYPVIPDYNNNSKELDEIINLITTIPSIIRIDILPFHQLGKVKWEKLEFNYILQNTSPLYQKDVEDIKQKIIDRTGLKVL